MLDVNQHLKIEKAPEMIQRNSRVAYVLGMYDPGQMRLDF